MNAVSVMRLQWSAGCQAFAFADDELLMVNAVSVMGLLLSAVCQAFEFAVDRLLLVNAFSVMVLQWSAAVSYTHLDVYKRQGLQDAKRLRVLMTDCCW